MADPSVVRQPERLIANYARWADRDGMTLPGARRLFGRPESAPQPLPPQRTIDPAMDERAAQQRQVETNIAAGWHSDDRRTTWTRYFADGFRSWSKSFG